jgi:hypothetical protein
MTSAIAPLLHRWHWSVGLPPLSLRLSSLQVMDVDTDPTRGALVKACENQRAIGTRVQARTARIRYSKSSSVIRTSWCGRRPSKQSGTSSDGPRFDPRPEHSDISIGSALSGAGDPMVRAPTFGLSGCHLPATIGLWDASDRPAEVIHPLGWPENDDSQGGDGSSG